MSKHPVVRAVELPFKAVDHLIHGKKRHQAAAAVQARARGKAARDRVVRQQAQASSYSQRFFGDCPTGWWKAPLMCLFFIAVLVGSGRADEWLSHVEAPPLPPAPPPFPPSPPFPPAMPFTPMFVTTSAVRGRMYDASAGAAALLVAMVCCFFSYATEPLKVCTHLFGMMAWGMLASGGAKLACRMLVGWPWHDPSDAVVELINVSAMSFAFLTSLVILVLMNSSHAYGRAPRGMV